MNARNRIAFVCLAIPAPAEIGLGLVCLTASAVMPYHLEVLGTGWTQLQPGYCQGRGVYFSHEGIR